MNLTKANALKGIVQDIMGVDPGLKTRKTEYVQARAICYAIMRNELGFTFQYIGRQFLCHHASVMSAMKMFHNEIEVSKSFRRNYEKALEVWKSECQEYIEQDPVLLKKTVQDLVKSNKMLSLEVQELHKSVKTIKQLINV